MVDFEVIGVPFDGYGRPGNQARAAGALRTAGLVAALGDGTVDGGDIPLPPPDPGRGPDTSLLNEPGLIAMTDGLRQQVGGALAAGRFPVVVGGDCSALLGMVAGLRAVVPSAGLVFVDGHEDSMPLDVSEDGEAANTEIGLLLGVTGGLLRGPLAQRRATLQRGNWRCSVPATSRGEGGSTSAPSPTPASGCGT
jgi:arginase